ncbi:head-tail connector protein [Snodgrassella sp. CFCC 13594]|uniref:head-tail connector protein n=1 Tax=Snodgrassella sp. CFCC 13594 TaxID=1775559 RepID=UPI00082EE54A|nr:head-tail connector protein [Snodgrassella sp. CFCC 13594]
MMFISVEELREWARIDDDAESGDMLASLIVAASEIVLAHIRDPDKIGWDLNNEATMPQRIKTATCLAATALYVDRTNGNPLTPAVRAVLEPLRALAYA